MKHTDLQRLSLKVKQKMRPRCKIISFFSTSLARENRKNKERLQGEGEDIELGTRRASAGFTDIDRQGVRSA